MSEERDLEVSVLAGLLDFHSDRAEAQASFLIACIFGLFTLLAIVQNIENEWLTFFLTIPYTMLALVGFHCLQRFRFYANMAESIESSLERYVKCIQKREMHPLIYAVEKVKGEPKTLPLKEYEIKLLRKYGYEGILKSFKKTSILRVVAIVIFGLPFLTVFGPKLASNIITLGLTILFVIVLSSLVAYGIGKRNKLQTKKE